MTLDDFENAFELLTGHPPFPWQSSLYERLRLGDFESIRVCDIPTGLGKTSIIAIWLIARALWPRNGGPFPRRLVYVVNRRTVVDQATQEVEKIRRALGSVATLAPLRDALLALATVSSAQPLAISTLRGEFADNAEWRQDPARPAVIVGTVDMIGSRLLFSGYGRCGFKSRPLHAGFLGQDSLIVHDEAHLEPAFQQLLDAVRVEQSRSGDPWPMQTVELTATSRSRRQVFGLSNTDLNHPDVAKRLTAAKALELFTVDDKKKVADAISQRALFYKDAGRAVLVFVRTIDEVARVSDALVKGTSAARVSRLTGTLRGLERDELIATPVFRRFINRSLAAESQETVYLVCTSAGEVGIDMSAGEIVCDLTPFDSMAQRLGRANRFGDGEAHVDVVHEALEGGDEANALHLARVKTLLLLRQLPIRTDGRHDASPAGLRTLPLDARLEAFTPTPAVLPATDILFDAWALTSVRNRLAGRPPVSDWLHGIPDEWTPPETSVAWRDEVELLTPSATDDWKVEEFEDLLEDYPVKPHELLKDRSDRVFAQFDAIAARHPHLHAWVIEREGDLRVVSMATLVQQDFRRRPVFDLADATVILSPAAGGIRGGFLDGLAEATNDERYDVADEWRDDSGRRRRVRTVDQGSSDILGMRLVRSIELPIVDESKAEEGEDETPSVWHWYVRPSSADDDGSRSALVEQLLDRHCMNAQRCAAAFVDALNAPQPVAFALPLAARHHDAGKARAIWQRGIGNNSFPDVVLAKSANRRSLAQLGYRHELGSLADIGKLPEFSEFSADVQDLLLHVVAAHHGRARPHFTKDESFDPEAADRVTAELVASIPRRFAHLQRRYGRWGLAYLESIIRAADAIASQPAIEVAPAVGGSR